MSMLSRYRKQGGFQQLLILLETCAPAKREQLMKLISAEDLSWAKLIQTKMLTLEKVFSWEAIHISEITTQLPPRTLAIALHALPKGAIQKATLTMAPMKRREVETFYSELTPSPGEIEAARIKFLTKARELENEGRLNLAQIDPAVGIKDVKVA